MPYLDLASHRIYYQDTGTGGTPLVLLHALGSSGEDWAFQVPDFAQLYQVVTPDLRGFGRSGPVPKRLTVPDMAADVWQLLEHLGVDQLHLLGFSMGGAVAYQMAAERPGRLRSLTVVNSLPCYRVNRLSRAFEVYRTLSLLHVMGMKRMGLMVARRMFPRPDQADMAERLASVFAATPRSAYLAGLRALKGWHVSDRLEQIACPTLVIAAEHDYTPLEEKRAFAARLPQGRFRVFEDSRHGTPFDSRDRFNTEVMAFLAEVEAATREPDRQSD